jgi:hypothetical protein
MRGLASGFSASIPSDLAGVSVALVTRTYAGAAESLLPALAHCIFPHVTGLGIEVVIVLDDTASDRSLGTSLLQWHSEAARAGQLRVAYEPLPAHARRIFAGNRERGGSRSFGQDRAEWSSFFADRYTSADIIGHWDAEVCFLAPPLPTLDAEGRLHNTVLLNYPVGDTWARSTALALPRAIKALVGAMETDYFPLFMWRKDLHAARALVAQSSAPPAHGGDHADHEDLPAFDAAFARLTRLPVGPHGASFSAFNIMFNAALTLNPTGYALHAATVGHHGLINPASKCCGPDSDVGVPPAYWHLGEFAGAPYRPLNESHAAALAQALPKVRLTTAGLLPAGANHNNFGAARGVRAEGFTMHALNKVHPTALDNLAEIGVWCCARFPKALGCEPRMGRTLPLRVPRFFEAPSHSLLALARRALSQRNQSEQRRALVACQIAKASVPLRWPIAGEVAETDLGHWRR